jgi:hypothetical protein
LFYHRLKIETLLLEPFMSNPCASLWLPPLALTSAQKPRRVGVEIEFTGVEADLIVALIQQFFNGTSRPITALEWVVEDTEFGKFKVELDAAMAKVLAQKQAKAPTQKQMDAQDLSDSLSGAAVDLMIDAAKQLVPWEIVTPPIPCDQLQTLVPLIAGLRKAGALGTRQALHYAFGVHLNPELPDHQPATLVKYLQAFFCLYDWIAKNENIDPARWLSPYINHFSKEYILLVINPQYTPDLAQLIDDYLHHNPTRNRSLDMLPLFLFLDEARVRAVIDDERVNGRPTLHYRLPNCDIDNPAWNIHVPWRLWLEVEKLVVDDHKRTRLCVAYAQELARLSHRFESRWCDYVSAEVSVNLTLAEG